MSICLQLFAFVLLVVMLFLVRKRFHASRRLALGLGDSLVLPLDCLVDFFTMNRNVRRRGDTKPDFVPAYVDDGNLYLVSDNYGFVSLSG